MTAKQFKFGIGILVNGLTQPFIGRLYDRIGARSLISVSLLVLGISVILMSRTNSLWFLIIVYGFVSSTAASGASLVTVHAMLAKWFHRKRGMVLSLVTGGTSAGSLVMAPFATYLIIMSNWRVAWFVLGSLILLLALPLAYLFIKETPESIGQAPDGDPVASEATNSALNARPRGPIETDSLMQSLKTGPIWQLTGAYIICGVTTAIISAHYVPFAIDRGASPATAALAFGIMNGLNVLGVIAVGSLADRFSRKKLLGATYALRGLSYAVLFVLPGVWGIWGFVLLSGLSWIATPPLTSSLTADIYGVKNLGTLAGITGMGHQLGGAASVFLVGFAYDALGSYQIPFGIAGLTLIIASILSFSVKENKYSSRYQTVSTSRLAAASGDAD